MIVCLRGGEEWLAVPAHRGDGRFRIEGLVPVRLVEEAEPFAVVLTRFDGAQCWYDGPDPRHDPGTAAYLRESLARMVEPEHLSRKGLTAEERAAYAMNYVPRLEAEIEVQARPRRGTAPRGSGPRGGRASRIPGARRRLPGGLRGRRSPPRLRGLTRRPVDSGRRHLPERTVTATSTCRAWSASFARRRTPEPP